MCDLSAFSGVVESYAWCIGAVHGTAVVDLVERRREPTSSPFTYVAPQEVFRDILPRVAVRIGS